MSKRHRLYGTPRVPPPEPISQSTARLLQTRPPQPPAALREPPPAAAPPADALAELDAALPPEPPEPDVAREALMLLRRGNQYLVVAIPYTDGTPFRILDVVKSSSGLVACKALTRRFQHFVGVLGLLKAAGPNDTTVPTVPEEESDGAPPADADLTTAAPAP